MRAVRYLEAIWDINRSFLTHPVESLRFLRLLPSAVRGSLSGSKLSRGSIPKPTPEVHQPPSTQQDGNALLNYFDSHQQGAGIWKWRHYFDIYQRHFEKFVGTEVHIAEVGVYSGGSLDMWRAYFGDRCRVYGIDIEESCRAYENEYTQIFIGDQADRSFWRRFRNEVPVLDIFVDDGGHRPDQQVATLEEILPHLQPGGIYLCEDIGRLNNEFAAFLSGLAARLNVYSNPLDAPVTSRAEGIQQSVDSIHLYPYVAVIEKASEPVQGFLSQKQGTEWQPFL